MQVHLAQPRGFCAGVTRAIAIVERALAIYGAPIYVRHEIVHNRTVVEDLRRRGAVFVDDLADVPEGSTLVFSAHGVPKAVEREAEERKLRVFDATCPLVTKVHKEVGRWRREGRSIIMIGHAGHPEVEGTMGQVEDGIHLVEKAADVPKLPFTDADTIAYVTQTTISADDSRDVIEALRARYPHIQEPKRQDICYATQNRQEAVKTLALSGVDVVFVIGSSTSSNSNRLREVAERQGVHAYLVDSAAHVDPKWLEGVSAIGITAGASAPESLVQGIVEWLRENFGPIEVKTLPGEEENVAFPLPKGLWESDLQAARAATGGLARELAGLSVRPADGDQKA
ncbi:4-hydroxy-3-methylbut-2-enyl diphosphate reductase [Sutterella sp.]|uniref:4-hydroxy-3-methylbut-2-enyl diphosphate reductase n=1 Tax=Sutterella sp. TaxID=1981025 RepID=UPI0026E0A40E|nr:4-hydroxy-3-methylbut-2-enyl diphosphate reductase [Sutterella sp.]MDO5532073.1 4-hydroxy-3-methylbut-2-enyl diphosphate reductase [Sutterella sp.]